MIEYLQYKRVYTSLALASGALPVAMTRLALQQRDRQAASSSALRLSYQSSQNVDSFGTNSRIPASRRSTSLIGSLRRSS